MKGNHNSLFHIFLYILNFHNKHVFMSLLSRHRISASTSQKSKHPTGQLSEETRLIQQIPNRHQKAPEQTLIW